MFKILFLLLLGVGIGYLLRNIRGIQKVDHTAHYTIIVLLFIFGVSIGANHDLISNSIGANHDLISNIGYFGWQAFVIAVLGMIGSFGTAYMFNRFINNKEQNNNER